MRRAAVLGALALAGCGGGDPEPRLDRPPSRSAEERVIRGWSAAVNRGDYAEAGRFFAPGAIVEQVREFRLRNAREAEKFSRSLPCRANVTDVRRSGDSVVAAFRLRPGTGPPAACDEDVRVRFRFRGGRFSEFRQLPGSAPGGSRTV